MPGSVQSVERAAAILRLLAEEDEPIGLAQIASALGLAKGTVHGILRTLEDVGFVEQDQAGGPYRVATEVFRLGWTKLDQNELRSKALNWTDALAARTGESARVAAFHARPGRGGASRLPRRRRHPGAGDRLGGPAARQRARQGAARVRPRRGAQRGQSAAAGADHRTITDRVVLQRELAEIRDLGWAGSVGEVEPDVAGIAAPIRDRGGYVVAVVGHRGVGRAGL